MRVPAASLIASQQPATCDPKDTLPGFILLTCCWPSLVNSRCSAQVRSICTLPPATMAMTPGDMAIALTGTALALPSRRVELELYRLGSHYHKRAAIHDLHTRKARRRLRARQ